MSGWVGTLGEKEKGGDGEGGERSRRVSVSFSSLSNRLGGKRVYRIRW